MIPPKHRYPCFQFAFLLYLKMPVRVYLLDLQTITLDETYHFSCQRRCHQAQSSFFGGKIYCSSDSPEVRLGGKTSRYYGDSASLFSLLVNTLLGHRLFFFSSALQWEQLKERNIHRINKQFFIEQLSIFFGRYL